MFFISSNYVCLFLFFQICLCICHSPCDCLHGPVPNHCFLLLLFFLFLFENIKLPNKTRGGGVLHQLLRARLHVRHPRENVHKLLVTEFKLSPLNPNCPSLDLSVFKDRRRYICRSYVFRVWFGLGFQILLEMTCLGIIFHLQKDS